MRDIPQGQPDPSIPGDVTQHACPAPEAYGQTHHLVPRSAGNGLNKHVCRYCKRDEADLRSQLEKAASRP